MAQQALALPLVTIWLQMLIIHVAPNKSKCFLKASDLFFFLIIRRTTSKLYPFFINTNNLAIGTLSVMHTYLRTTYLLQMYSSILINVRIKNGRDLWLLITVIMKQCKSAVLKIIKQLSWNLCALCASVATEMMLYKITANCPAERAVVKYFFWQLLKIIVSLNCNQNYWINHDRCRWLMQFMPLANDKGRQYCP